MRARARHGRSTMTTQKTMLFAAQVFISPASVLDGRPTMVHDYRNDNTTETPGNLLMRRVRKELRELTLSGHSRLANPPPHTRRHTMKVAADPGLQPFSTEEIRHVGV